MITLHCSEAIDPDIDVGDGEWVGMGRHGGETR